jgi:glucose-6-phosphate isomerase
MKQLNFNYDHSLILEEELALLLRKTSDLSSKIKQESHKKYDSDYAFGYTPFDEQNIAIIDALIKKKKKLKLAVIIVIGIGGSNLGTIALYEAMKGKFYNLNTKKTKAFFADTVDSDYIANIYDFIEHELKENKNILINVISKSGTTTETIANFEIFIALLKKYKPKDFNDYIVITTDKNSMLWNFAKEIQCDLLEIPKKVGGRYSVFTAVGLFPLGFLEINIQDLLDGAKEIQEKYLSTLHKNYAAISACLLYHHYKQKINIHDSFFFSVDLESIGKWYRQLMGESIGKTNRGITPTVSIGSTDLHSLLQLTLAGPIDKFTTFVTVKNNKRKINIPNFNEFESIVSNIQALELSTVMQAILNGTQAAYTKEKRPFCTITLKDKSEKTVGQFLQFKMFEMVYLADLFDINPFDQPNVEMYKEETRKILKNSR